MSPPTTEYCKNGSRLIGGRDAAYMDGDSTSRAPLQNNEAVARGVMINMVAFSLVLF